MSGRRNSPGSARPAPDNAVEAAQEQELLGAIIHRLGIRQWDLLLVGDGSGSGWAQSCGWASVLIDRNNLLGRVAARRFFYGAMNQGSVNIAEAMPYLQALQWYDVHFGKEMLKTRGLLQVHVLTDSQTIAHWGTQAMTNEVALPRKCLVIWAAMRELRRLGYHITMHWAPRMTTQLNWASDLVAGLSRTHIKDALGITIDPTIAIRAAQALDHVVFKNPSVGADGVYNLNPDGDSLHVDAADHAG